MPETLAATYFTIILIYQMNPAEIHKQATSECTSGCSHLCCFALNIRSPAGADLVKVSMLHVCTRQPQVSCGSLQVHMFVPAASGPDRLGLLLFISQSGDEQSGPSFTSASPSNPSCLWRESVQCECGGLVEVLFPVPQTSAPVTLALQCILVKSNSEHLEQV